MASLANLPATGTLLLNAFAREIEAFGVTLPDRQYVAPTPIPVWDGEQFTVALMGIAQGQPGATFGGTFVATSLNQFAQFSVSIVRIVSVLQTDGRSLSSAIPDADENNADGLQTLGDAAALWYAAAQVHASYVATSPGEGFEIGSLQTVGPEGGLSGTRLLISISVD